VAAIERDFRCMAALADLAAAYPERLDLIEADALDVDPVDLVQPPRMIVANLPYNVAVPLLLGWLYRINEYAGLTVMLQKEVADRLAARPRDKAYGRLSVLAQWLCSVECQFNVDRRAFTPPPKVTSTVVTLVPRREPVAPVDRAVLEKVTAAAFGQRRKMLRTSLKPLSLDLEALGIDPTARAEELTVEAFCRLAQAYARNSR